MVSIALKMPFLKTYQRKASFVRLIMMLSRVTVHFQLANLSTAYLQKLWPLPRSESKSR